MKLSYPFAALLLLAFVAPLRADPPQDKPLPGERVGGEGQNLRANRRVDNRLPTRLNTRVQPRMIGKPLVAANSQIISDTDNGCARNPGQPATDTAPSAQACQGPQ